MSDSDTQRLDLAAGARFKPPMLVMILYMVILAVVLGVAVVAAVGN